jgi:hypothetical protein
MHVRTNIFLTLWGRGNALQETELIKKIIENTGRLSIRINMYTVSSTPMKWHREKMLL